MAKVTQGHIDCLVNWMKRNPGKSLNVSGTWRNNGYEVHNGHQTMARNKAYKALEEQGYEIDRIKGTVISRRVLPKTFDKKLDGTPKEAVQPKAKLEEKPETAITIEPPKKPKEMKAKAKITKKPNEEIKADMNLARDDDGIMRLTDSKVEVLSKAIIDEIHNYPNREFVKPVEKNQFNYTVDLSPDTIQPIAESLQGMMHTANLMGQKAKVKITIEMGE